MGLFLFWHGFLNPFHFVLKMKQGFSMDWLKNLFDKTRFPDLKKQRAPRAPRVALLDLHHIHFRCSDPPFPHEIALVNLSVGGVGLLKNSLPATFPIGAILRGSFHFEGQTYPVEMKVAHASHEVLGCAFVEIPAAFSELVHRYFDVELSALKMNRIKPDLLQEEPDGIPHWFQGQNNCDLFFVTKDDKLIRFQLSFFANYIEGGSQQPTRFGQVLGDNLRDKPKLKDTSSIRWDASLAKGLEIPAIKFIRNISQLSVEEKTALIALIKKVAN